MENQREILCIVINRCDEMLVSAGILVSAGVLISAGILVSLKGNNEIRWGEDGGFFSSVAE